jgi:hypothetical protein
VKLRKEYGDKKKHVSPRKNIPSKPPRNLISSERNLKTPGNHLHQPFKQNSSHPVAIHYQNNTKTTQGNPSNNEKTPKTLPNTNPLKQRGVHPHPHHSKPI